MAARGKADEMTKLTHQIPQPQATKNTVFAADTGWRGRWVGR